MREPIFNPAGDRVGWISDEEDGVPWIIKPDLGGKTTLDPVTHHLEKPKGWCLDAVHVRMLADKPGEGKGIRLYVSGGQKWECTLRQWMGYARAVPNYGHGGQQVLPDMYWNHQHPEGRQEGFPENGQP